MVPLPGGIPRSRVPVVAGAAIALLLAAGLVLRSRVRVRTQEERR
jgi:hypothetical protein